ncbi:hypothetical protein M0R45_013418 [Rubus argutus]|uniref:Uncharacterized protein n=1 Tax=Rubus argutus TaxID=59490 RepID=A0AAW1XL44_RUBAR
MESYHIHALLPNQCGSCLVQTIDAPLPLVWSIIRQFDKPQAYKQFITSCTMLKGSGGIGSIREVMLYYESTTVQEVKGRKTVVIQSYVVDVPAGSSKEDTCLFANTIIGCNLRSLAKVTERMAD